ncbi:N-acetyltransferase [Plantactinospora sp. BB1]|uniref:GNAT family N-acetyltransferase n=1 Tax=Plantactinospora sp. BB1 TaxID=2071627 RepID=UPI00131F1093|nr:GNAT family N-acetyltransferase [Plantactinospora sp. BB1]
MSDDLPTVRLEPVTADNWRDCTRLQGRPDQADLVMPVVYNLCQCAYGGVWQPLAITRSGRVVGFVMWGRDDDRSIWIGGLLVDAGAQRSGVARSAVRQLQQRFAAEPDCPNVALSYPPSNTAARDLYASLGFRETGETEDDGAEVVARWFPERVSTDR